MWNFKHVLPLRKQVYLWAVYMCVWRYTTNKKDPAQKYRNIHVSEGFVVDIYL